MFVFSADHGFDNFCKIFELLIINEVRNKCYSPDSQFGFQPRLGCCHALSAVASILVDAKKTGESLALAAYDVQRAFDSLIHDELILDMGKRGVKKGTLLPLKDMYANLKAELKLSHQHPDHKIKNNPVVPVKKGARQGAITSPTAFNNTIIRGQERCKTTCVLRCIDVSLISYADDIFN